MLSLPQNSSATPQFIRDAGSLGSRLGLERVAELCALLGDPQDRVPAVHVAGTNGKGSVSAMTASMLTAAGLKTGLYTSPYIQDIRECLSVDGAPIPDGEFARIAGDIEPHARRMAGDGAPPTQFEIETAAAFLWFARRGCAAAVVETGLGGRLDATNVIARPRVSVLTPISLDHTAILGDTIERIAREKCGIIKPGGVTVACPAQREEAWRVIRQSAAEAGNALVVPDMTDVRELSFGLSGTDIEYKGLRLHIPLTGRHQVMNAVTAVETALALRERRGMTIPDEAVAAGMRAARMPMRQEWFAGRPGVLLDGAHNPDGLLALADTIKRFLAGRRTAVVMGMLADKDVEPSVGLIAPLCGKFVACRPMSPRALPSERAAEVARKHCADVTVRDDIAGALEEAGQYAGAEGAVVVCGSLYLAGPARKSLFS
jgi:dihydrofolate synthase/folylpolyglutamate synthase